MTNLMPYFYKKIEPSRIVGEKQNRAKLNLPDFILF